MNDFKLEELKTKLDTLYQHFNDLYQVSKSKIVLEARNNLLTYKEELDKGLFFITVQGNLKTGKSTLINILARKEVAITRSGVDTTASPYIITKSTDGADKIIEYYATEGLEKDDEKAVYQNIINDIKGLTVNDDRFNKRKKEFNLAKVENYTVKTTDKNTLLINIQIVPEENGILDRDDIAILDTPGVDGDKAEEYIQQLKTIMERSNMLVVLQSSITPFNRQQKESLNSFKEMEPEIRLIHNEFDLKNWASQDDRDDFYETQTDAISNAVDALKEIFQKVYPHKRVDLAKVDAYRKNRTIYNKKMDVKNSYDIFIEFEKDLQEYIELNRTRLKKINATNSLLEFFKLHTDVNNDKINTLSTLNSSISKNRNKIEIDKQDIKKDYDNFIKLIKKISKKIKPFLKQQNIKREIIEILDDYQFSEQSIPKNLTKKALVIHTTTEDVEMIQKQAITRLNTKIYQYLADELLTQIEDYSKELQQEEYDNLNEKFSFYNIPLVLFSMDKSVIPKTPYVSLQDKEIEKILKDNIRKAGRFTTNTSYNSDNIIKSLKDCLTSNLELEDTISNIINYITDQVSISTTRYINQMEEIEHEEENTYTQFHNAYQDKHAEDQQVYTDIITQIKKIFQEFESVRFMIDGVK